MNESDNDGDDEGRNINIRTDLISARHHLEPQILKGARRKMWGEDGNGARRIKLR